MESVRFRREKVPTLVELCVQSAIDNIHLLGDVGQTDMSLLRGILPHCNAEQLLRIESSSRERDLSSITDELWRKFYTRKFGPENAKLVIERMKKRGVNFKWHLLYQAKLREQEEVQKKCVDRLKQLYVKADKQKQSRQIQMCSKVPPTSKRRKCEVGGGGSRSCFSNVKGPLMKKAKLECATSHEAKIHQAIRKRHAASNVTLVAPQLRKLIPPSQNMPPPPSQRKDIKNVTTSKNNTLPSAKSKITVDYSVDFLSKGKLSAQYSG